MILQYFKEEFTLRLKKGIFPDYDDLLKKTLFEFNTHREEISEDQFLEWFQNICQLNFLAKFIDDLQNTEIILHSNYLIQVEKNSQLVSYKVNIAQDIFQLSLEYLALVHNQTWNYSDPFASFQAQVNGHNFRVTMSHQSMSPLHSPKIFLRRQNNTPFDLCHFMLPENVEKFIVTAITDKKNMMISGATGSGKTSFMKTLLHHVPANEHVITLEDTHELTDLPKNWTSLIAHDKLDGHSLNDLCAYSLRMRPDRIILGEVRSKEAIPFLLSMNNGHKGLMGTIHANSAQDTLHRMTLLFSLYAEKGQIPYPTIMQLVCKNLDYIVFIENKKVVEISKVLGAQDDGLPLISEIYSVHIDQGNLKLIDREYLASNFD